MDWRLVLCALWADIVSFAAGAAVASSRSVYYFHTNPAPWAAARDTCSRYGGIVINVQDADTVLQDLALLDTVLGWDNAFSSLQTQVWTGLTKFGSTASDVKWHSCVAAGTISTPNTNIETSLTSSTSFCTSMMPANLTMETKGCSTSLPYLCHVYDGQCWFLPVEDTSMRVVSGATEVDVLALGLNDCAQECRNRAAFDADGVTVVQCWSFAVDNGECKLYKTSARHSYILQRSTHLQDTVNSTVYLKICAGGDITTMAPVTSDNSVEPQAEDCLVNVTDAAWDTGICYCDCDQPPVILEPEYLVLSTEEKVDQIIKELTVNPTNLSSSLRKLNSAKDSRPSAQSLGALGICMMVVVFGGLMAMDLSRLISHISSSLKSGEVTAIEHDEAHVKAA